MNIKKTIVRLRLLGIGCFLGLAVFVFQVYQNRPDAATCAAIQSVTNATPANCEPISWITAYVLVAAGIVLLAASLILEGYQRGSIEYQNRNHP